MSGDDVCEKCGEKLKKKDEEWMCDCTKCVEKKMKK